MSRAVLCVVTLLACRERPVERAPPRGLMDAMARCTDRALVGDVRADRVEATIRRAVATRREEFAVQAGRCEDELGPGESTPECLAPLRAAWGRMLTVAQSPAPDAIALEVAVRHVGDAWTTARQRCE